MSVLVRAKYAYEWVTVRRKLVGVQERSEILESYLRVQMSKNVLKEKK